MSYMSKSNYIIIFIIFVIVSMLLLVNFFYSSDKSVDVLVKDLIENEEVLVVVRQKNQKLCPEAWIKDQMPIVGEAPLIRQYFVVSGDRWEFDELDIEWVKQNCSINKPMTVF